MGGAIVWRDCGMPVATAVGTVTSDGTASCLSSVCLMRLGRRKLAVDLGAHGKPSFSHLIHAYTWNDRRIHVGKASFPIGQIAELTCHKHEAQGCPAGSGTERGLVSRMRMPAASLVDSAISAWLPPDVSCTDCLMQQVRSATCLLCCLEMMR